MEIPFDSNDPTLFYQLWMNLLSTKLLSMELTGYDISGWSDCCRSTFLLCFRVALRRGQTDENVAFASILIYENIDNFLALPAHSIVWLLDICRKLETLGIAIQDAIKHKVVTVVKCRYTSFSTEYQFKIIAALLRLSPPLELVSDTLMKLLRDRHCQGILRDIISEDIIKQTPQQSFALLALDPRPQVLLFLWRLTIYLLEASLQSGVLPMEFIQSVPWECWQWSLGLIALFNEHDGLLYKALTRITRIESEYPIILDQYHEQFSSMHLYKDVLYRIDHDPILLEQSIIANPHCLSYVYTFHRLLVEGLLFNQVEYYGDQKAVMFHSRLCEQLIKYDHLGPLQMMLKRATHDPSI